MSAQALGTAESRTPPAPPDAGAGKVHQACRRGLAQGKVRIYRRAGRVFGAALGGCAARGAQ